jgi:hypothetical protein
MKMVLNVIKPGFVVPCHQFDAKTSSMPKAATRAVLQKNSTAEMMVASDVSFGTWNFQHPSEFGRVISSGKKKGQKKSRVDPLTCNAIIAIPCHCATSETKPGDFSL